MMKKKSKLLITCEEASCICDKTQYKESTFWERLKLKLHLLICGVCKKYSANNGKLSSLCNKAHLNGLSQDKKEEMKKCLQRETLNQNQ